MADSRAVEDIIWSHEIAIYEGRGEGSLENYLRVAHEDFAGWPPHWSTPSDYNSMEAQNDAAQSLRGEKVDLLKKQIVVTGDIALAYYSTHRTRLGGGEVVDQHFDVLHVWGVYDGEWKLIGGMAREVSGEPRPLPPR
ncbi:MAG: hypothetical protein WD448_03315 [Woeseia sp.]